jgi:hypothetical protein
LGVGYQALANNTTGGNNEAIGSYRALYSNTTGSSNVAVGRESLYSNTTGSYNTGIGQQALQANTTASNNTAVGYQAGYSNTTGTYHTALGYAALYSNTTSTYNTAVGYQAGFSNTTGYEHVLLGVQTGFSSTTSRAITAVGYQAGYAVTTAQYGTFVGRNAGLSVTTGGGNNFFGVNGNSAEGAGHYVTTGSKNTILGGYNGNQGSLDIRTASNYIVLSDGDGNPREVYNSSGALGLNGPNYGTSGQVLTSNGSSAVPTWTTVSGGSAAGSNTQIQYNNGGAFAATAAFTYNGSVTAPQVIVGGASGVTTSYLYCRAPSAAQGPYVGMYAGANTANIFWSYDSGGTLPLTFQSAGVGSGTERMRLTSGGNLLINTSTDNGAKLQVDGSLSMVSTSNGIQCHSYSTITNGSIAFYNAYNNSDPRITFYGGTGSNLTYSTANLALYPGTDGGLTLGLSSNRWGQIYSTSSSISTSDAREKEQVESLNDAELRVASRLKLLIRKFKWTEAVKKKGDAARIHVGIIAQDVQSAFESEGLDAHRYGLFCYDSVWIRIEENDDLKTGGKVVQKIPCSETEEGAICETRYGIRYEELLAFIMASM